MKSGEVVIAKKRGCFFSLMWAAGDAIVIGGSGSGKTRGYVKPNLMQCESSSYPVSFVVTDPKGTIPDESGTLLVRPGEYDELHLLFSAHEGFS